MSRMQGLLSGIAIGLAVMAASFVAGYNESWILRAFSQWYSGHVRPARNAEQAWSQRYGSESARTLRSRLEKTVVNEGSMDWPRTNDGWSVHTIGPAPDGVCHELFQRLKNHGNKPFSLICYGERPETVADTIVGRYHRSTEAMALFDVRKRSMRSLYRTALHEYYHHTVEYWLPPTRRDRVAEEIRARLYARRHLREYCTDGLVPLYQRTCNRP